MADKKDSHQHCNQDSGNFEWHTPQKLVIPVTKVLGGIDLDPASSAQANKLVGAKKIYTKKDNGLLLPWHGNVWLNHPYGKPEQPCKKLKSGDYSCKKDVCKKRGYHIDDYKPGNPDWINKLVDEFKLGNIKKAACLTWASTSENWFRPLLDFPQLYLYDRVAFINEKGEEVKGGTKGSVITFFGCKKGDITYHTKHLGKVKL